MRARSRDEIALYIALHPCATCGTPASAASLEYSASGVDANRARYSYTGTCKQCGTALAYDFDGPRGWADLGGAYGGDEPSTIIAASEWIAQAHALGEAAPDDPSALGRDEFFQHHGGLRRALAMLAEAKKLGSPTPTDALQRKSERYAALVATMNGADRPAPQPMASFGRDALEAHQQWLARGKQGAGRLVIQDTSVGGLPLGNLKVSAAKLTRVGFDRAKVDFADFVDAELTECTAQAANFAHTKFDRARLDRCNFEGAGLVLTDFVGARVTGGDFRAINADRGAWSGVVLAGVDLRKARFGDCVLDGATVEK
jgi:hypothetical protein